MKEGTSCQIEPSAKQRRPKLTEQPYGFQKKIEHYSINCMFETVSKNFAKWSGVYIFIPC